MKTAYIMNSLTAILAFESNSNSTTRAQWNILNCEFIDIYDTYGEGLMYITNHVRVEDCLFTRINTNRTIIKGETL